MAINLAFYEEILGEVTFSDVGIFAAEEHVSSFAGDVLVVDAGVTSRFKHLIREEDVAELRECCRRGPPKILEQLSQNTLNASAREIALQRLATLRVLAHCLRREFRLIVR